MNPGSAVFSPESCARANAKRGVTTPLTTTRRRRYHRSTTRQNISTASLPQCSPHTAAPAVPGPGCPARRPSPLTSSLGEGTKSRLAALSDALLGTFYRLIPAVRITRSLHNNGLPRIKSGISSYPLYPFFVCPSQCWTLTDKHHIHPCQYKTTTSVSSTAELSFDSTTRCFRHSPTCLRKTSRSSAIFRRATVQTASLTRYETSLLQPQHQHQPGPPFAALLSLQQPLAPMRLL